MLLIGAHTSIAGGVHNALLHGKEIGATTIQLFTANQRRWDSKPIDAAEVDLWFNTKKETGITTVMSHDSYLINLGSCKEEIIAKSRKTFEEEYKRCKLLEISFLNFHPGAAVDCDATACLDKIVESLLLMEPLVEKESPRFLLEATAGQGAAVGCRFEELAYIVKRVEKKIPIGVCIDTCHIFSAGYDIRTAKGVQETLKEFDTVVGLKYLYAFHLNDSMKALGSRVDRHADLGTGQIGIECFKELMKNPATRDLPKYLETPGGMPVWETEIKLLRQFAAEK